MKKIVMILLILGIYTSINAQNRPANTYRDGKIQIAVWVDTLQTYDSLIIKKNFKVSKDYKVNDKWVNSDYFDADEIIRLKALLDEVIKKEKIVK